VTEQQQRTWCNEYDRKLLLTSVGYCHVISLDRLRNPMMNFNQDRMSQV